MADADTLVKIFEGVVVAWVVFISQDYIRFRFNPPFVTGKQCEAAHKAANIIADKREENINHLRDRMEARMDRLEGLILVALTRKAKPDGNDILNGLFGVDAPGKG